MLNCDQKRLCFGGNIDEVCDQAGVISCLLRGFRGRLSRRSFDAVDAEDSLIAYDWPGNVRELENTLLKTLTQCGENMITADLLPGTITGIDNRQSEYQYSGVTLPSIGLSLEDVEKANIKLVPEEARWHKGLSCERLGITRPRLRRLIEKYELKSDPKKIDMSDKESVVNDY